MAVNKIKSLMNGPYDIPGYYGEYARDLAKRPIDNPSKSTVFASGIELFIAAAIVGVLYDVRKKPVRLKEGGEEFSIFSDQFRTHYDDVKFAYQLVMLNADKERLSPRERINNAFKYVTDENDPRYQKNAEVFEEYVLGGIETLHDIFINTQNSRYDDYLHSLKEFLNRNNYPNDDESLGDIDFSDPFN